MESLQSQKPQHKVKWSLNEVMKPSVTWQTLRFTSLKRRLQSVHALCIGKWQQCGCIVMPTTGCHKVPADEVPAAKSQLSKHSNYKHSSCCCLYLLHCVCACVWMHASFFFINAYKKILFIKVYSCLCFVAWYIYQIQISNRPQYKVQSVLQSYALTGWISECVDETRSDSVS